MDRIKDAFSNLGRGTKRIFSNFGVTQAYGSSKHFFQTNTLIAKVAFLLLMVILFLIVVRMGTAAMVWFASPSPDPSFWISGTCNKGSGGCNYSRYQPDGTVANTWMQGGGAEGIDCGKCSKSRCQTVLRSKNGRYGIYVTNGKVNVTLPKENDYNTLDLNTAISMIKNKKPTKKRFKRK